MEFVRPSLVAIDPRYFQIGALSVLLLYGCTWLNFEIDILQIAVTLVTAIGIQLLMANFVRTDKSVDRVHLILRGAPGRASSSPESKLTAPTAWDIRSALITGLSLCLLLRTNTVWYAALASAVAILSKFVFRFRGKHLFNPANLGLVVLLLAGPRVAWCSTGQWGSTAVLTFFFVCLGLLVVYRARRADISLIFLVGYALLLFGRSAMLGEPWTIPWHRLQSGALLLFAFFMISDPRSTPNSSIGRLIFALLVVTGAGFIQFGLNRPNGPFLSLAFFSLLVPSIDWLFPSARYEWSPVRLKCL
jgi:Na+-translocating ferredoxin:NAD+ oxidoreductase RnfD subunit